MLSTWKCIFYNLATNCDKNEYKYKNPLSTSLRFKFDINISHFDVNQPTLVHIYFKLTKMKCTALSRIPEYHPNTEIKLPCTKHLCFLFIFIVYIYVKLAKMKWMLVPGCHPNFWLRPNHIYILL